MCDLSLFCLRLAPLRHALKLWASSRIPKQHVVLWGCWAFAPSPVYKPTAVSSSHMKAASPLSSVFCSSTSLHPPSGKLLKPLCSPTLLIMKEPKSLDYFITSHTLLLHFAPCCTLTLLPADVLSWFDLAQARQGKKINWSPQAQTFFHIYSLFPWVCDAYLFFMMPFQDSRQR